MIVFSNMYELIRGPLLWVALLIFISSIIARTILLYRLTNKKPGARRPVTKISKNKSNLIVSILGRLRRVPVVGTGTFYSTSPFFWTISVVFHLSVIITPFLVLGHGVLFLESWGVRPFGFGETLGDGLTMVCVVSGLALVIRRAVVADIRALSAVQDYVALVITILPFVTGYLAYHQVYNYEIMMNLHILSVEVLLVFASFSKLGHMVFFFFARFTVSSEFSLVSGSRQW